MKFSKTDRFSALPDELRQHILSFAGDLFTLRKCSTINHAFAEDASSLIKTHALPLARKCLKDSESFAHKARASSSSLQPNTNTNTFSLPTELDLQVHIAWSIGAALEWQLLVLHRVRVIIMRPDEAPNPEQYLVGRDLSTDSRVRRERLLTDFRTFSDLTSMLHLGSLGRADWWLTDDIRALIAQNSLHRTSSNPGRSL